MCETPASLLGWRADGSITKEQQIESKISLAVFKLLRLLDQTVRAKRGGRFIPLRMYVSICPVEHDGCGKLFAKSRIYQEHCSRTCTVRHQVRECRKRAEQKKKIGCSESAESRAKKVTKMIALRVCALYDFSGAGIQRKSLKRRGEGFHVRVSPKHAF